MVNLVNFNWSLVHKLKPILTGRLIIVVTVLVLGLIVIFSLNSEKNKLSDFVEHKITLKVGGTKITAETANTGERLIQGLSGRETLAENTGMYFVLGKRKIATFWMKDMLFPLDIIWIDRGAVVGIDKDAPIPSKEGIPSYTSPGPVTHVLEVNAGFADKINLKVGSKVNKAN